MAGAEPIEELFRISSGISQSSILFHRSRKGAIMEVINMKGMGNMMKQAQKLQSKMLKLQEELAEKSVETTAGGGMIKVVANGRQQILSIKIDKEVVDPEDVEMLQDLILAAVNDALTKAQDMVAAEMGKLTGGFNLPGLL